MTWLDSITSWTIVTSNPDGSRLPQPASSFNQAWLLAKPPQSAVWTTRPKEEVYELFHIGARQVPVAAHTNGTIRYIHRGN
jgi:hypothetical protein